MRPSTTGLLSSRGPCAIFISAPRDSSSAAMYLAPCARAPPPGLCAPGGAGLRGRLRLRQLRPPRGPRRSARAPPRSPHTPQPVVATRRGGEGGACLEAVLPEGGIPGHGAQCHEIPQRPLHLAAHAVPHPRPRPRPSRDLAPFGPACECARALWKAPHPCTRARCLRRLSGGLPLPADNSVGNVGATADGCKHAAFTGMVQRW